ncbi:MAG: Hsp70 family protein [Pseudomonadota bacterium]
MSANVYGIDLGTTYSCIAFIDEYQRPDVIENIDGEKTTPSVVYFEGPNNVVVGKHAKSEAKINPEMVVQLIKREMGDEDWQIEAFGETYNPIRISSIIIEQIVKDASERLPEPVTDVVITVPAYFGGREREATRQAGIAAGLNVHSIIPEPMAAAIFHGLDDEEEGAVMVYDLGGGTFDITIIKLQDRSCEAIATGGNKLLGGADWDAIMAMLIADKVATQAGVAQDEVTGTPVTWNDILVEAEGLKKSLSRKETAATSIGFGEGDKHARYTVEITREEFDEATSSELERTIEYSKQVIAEAASKGVDTIDKIVLVGGSTKMPQVRERLEQEFDCPLEMSEPDLAVAKGAAMFGRKVQIDAWLEEWAGLEGGSYKDMSDEDKEKGVQKFSDEFDIPVATIETYVDKVITPITPKSFGILAHPSRDHDRKACFNLILYNQAVPVSVASSDFSTREENQPSLRIQCMENLRDSTEPFFDYDEEDMIGEAVLELPPNLPAHSELYIELGYTEDGRVDLLAREPRSGMEVSSRFEPKGVLSEEELEEMKRKNQRLTISS